MERGYHQVRPKEFNKDVVTIVLLCYMTVVAITGEPSLTDQSSYFQVPVTLHSLLSTPPLKSSLSTAVTSWSQHSGDHTVVDTSATAPSSQHWSPHCDLCSSSHHGQHQQQLLTNHQPLTSHSCWEKIVKEEVEMIFDNKKLLVSVAWFK